MRACVRVYVRMWPSRIYAGVRVCVCVDVCITYVCGRACVYVWMCVSRMYVGVRVCICVDECVRYVCERVCVYMCG